MKVDIGAETFDAFADVDFADAFLLGDVSRAFAWAALGSDSDAKGRGLVSATRLLTRLPYCVTPGPLPTDPDLPAVLSEVTAMLASDLLTDPQLFADASANSNLKAAGAGPARVEFFAPVAGAPPIPLALWTMLKNAGLVGCAAGEADGNAGAWVSGICGGERPLGGRYPWDWPVAEQDHL